jgi:hypothetical protein
MVINFSDVQWAIQAGFTLSVIRLALRDAADGFCNFPDALVWNQLMMEV